LLPPWTGAASKAVTGLSKHPANKQEWQWLVMPRGHHLTNIRNVNSKHWKEAMAGAGKSLRGAIPPH
jgi:hypothetical protein